MGFFSGIKKAFSNPVRALETIGSIGSSEIARNVLGGVDPLSVAAPLGLGFLTGNPMMGAQLAGNIYGAQMQARSVQEQNAMNIALANQQMAFSAQQAAEQMRFQERMSSTSIQRAQADMLAAGINPMLAPTAQESSPSGAMGSFTRANVEAVPAVAQTMMATAKDWISTLQQVKASNAQIENTNADTGLKRAEQENVLANVPGSSARTVSAKAEAWADANRNRVERGFPRLFGWTDAIMNRMSGVVNSALNAVTGGLGGYIGARARGAAAPRRFSAEGKFKS